jgi:hypothetical protein
LGRLNAALNQTINMDRSVKDFMEHFVYVPRKPTANPQDIPFFLSTRLEDTTSTTTASTTTGAGAATTTGAIVDKDTTTTTTTTFSLDTTVVDPTAHLLRYETEAAKLAADYESKMIRF